VNPVADLALTKTDKPDPAHVGQPLTYTITVTNNGPLTASGVTMTDNLPKKAGFGSASTTQGVCSYKSSRRIVACNIGNVTSGSSVVVTIVIKPTAKGTIQNTATVSATSPTDPNPNNNTATATTVVVP
jgi:uncharacterized repeat protein (TIGR01451 family)